ncbi:cytochrome B [Picosynechococcus sp. PCC 7003]|uniref:cytochrome b/b6 domain-containing protein n=1 Tax=Picosynechococcus sp. PCC 7003 TaxID=374981 RepID=UPI0008108554|nr:cytochrome b/b6 domain-containing protein [Picosynechococcus sp. PCC 7003]ANV84553.1 cytochrome B [Picosynechococcus sp. PCC 7003]
MAQSKPYQPILLRLLHGLTAILVLLALDTGFWVYDIYDGRWGRLGLPRIEAMQGIHGTIALTFFLLLPFFAVYSFRLGDRRLLQPNSLAQLRQVGKSIWWVSAHRLINTGMLLAGTLAVVTGRMMKEEWLPAGELNHLAYFGHLLAWVVMFGALALHLLLGIKVGGVPLLASMISFQQREGDRPKNWLQGFQKQQSLLLKSLEIIVGLGVLFALVVPLLSV